MSPTTRLAIWLSVATCQRISDATIEAARQRRITPTEAVRRTDRDRANLKALAEILREART